MTVSQQFLIETMLWIGGATIGVLGALLGLIWRQLQRQLEIVHKRLQTLGHEDRDIRSQMNGILLQLLAKSENERPAEIEDLLAENRRLKYIINEYKRQYSGIKDRFDTHQNDSA